MSTLIDITAILLVDHLINWLTRGSFHANPDHLIIMFLVIILSKVNRHLNI